MRIAVLGGGPAGLSFATLWKLRHPDDRVRVVEQNPSDATWGFGVVFSDRAMEFLAADDPATADLITRHMAHWRDITLVKDGVRIAIDGVGFSAIGRLELLQLLVRRAREAGVELVHGHVATSLAEFADADLIVGADGLNSLVRRSFEADFGTSLDYLDNKFAWYGTTKPFDTLTQTFVRSPHGPFNAHHYRYSETMSTFIVECERDTWLKAGFADMSEDDSLAACESVFAEALDGHRLIGNRSIWRNFPKLWCSRWTYRNMALIGDAVHTAHFSIGSGTRLALEDSIALVKALEAHPGDLPAGLAHYDAARRPVARKIVDAALTSAAWYEGFGARMALDPYDFAMSYITRSGRVDDIKLAAMAPKFMAAYTAAKSARIVDPVGPDDDAAREIGFETPETYNASAILFDNLDRGNGGRIAVRTAAGELTYDALCRQAARFGNALLAQGLKRGDRVMLVMDDTPDYPAAIFGAIRAGLVPMLINTQSTPDLINFYLQDSGARVAVIDGEFLGHLRAQDFAGARLERIIVTNAGATPHCGVETVLAEEVLAAASDTLACAPTHRDDMAFWMYSSGSTGRPKGVVHLQHDMAYTHESYARHVLKLTADDVCFSVPKIFFAYGFGNSITFPFAVGATSVLLAGRPDPAAIVRTIQDARPTVFFGLPTLYTALINAPEIADAALGSVRLWVSAAETLAAEIGAGWKALSGRDIVEGLGSTEMLHIYLSNSEEALRQGAAGRRVPGYALKLTDREGREVAPGEEGILWIRGHSSAPLYWNRPDRTEETMRGPWIWTGDRFVVDADGFHYFRGRADDLIKVSGQWVYPLEVELCLADHPDVRECAVLAHELADRRMTLRAVVALKEGRRASPATVKALQEHVKARLTPYKYPRIVEFDAELPKTGTGKIDRQALARRPLSSGPAPKGPNAA